MRQTKSSLWRCQLHLRDSKESCACVHWDWPDYFTIRRELGARDAHRELNQADSQILGQLRQAESYVQFIWARSEPWTRVQEHEARHAWAWNKIIGTQIKNIQHWHYSASHCNSHLRSLVWPHCGWYCINNALRHSLRHHKSSRWRKISFKNYEKYAD